MVAVLHGGVVGQLCLVAVDFDCLVPCDPLCALAVLPGRACVRLHDDASHRRLILRWRRPKG